MKLFVVVITFFLLSACTSKTIYKKPENLIPRDTMVALLSDIYLATSATELKTKKGKIHENYMPFVYNKYKIDSVRFLESNIYYTSLVSEYVDILKEAEKLLVEKRNIYEKEYNRLDSIKKARLDTISPVVSDSISKLKIDTKKESIEEDDEDSNKKLGVGEK